MRQSTLLLFFALTAMSLTAQDSLRYKLTLNVRPSFSAEVTYSIKKDGDLLKVNGADYKILAKDSLLAKYFVELDKVLLDAFNMSSYQEDHGIWTDGTRTTITAKLNGVKRIFEFDNSGRNTLLNHFVPPLYSIIHYLHKDAHSDFKLSEEELRDFEASENTVIMKPIRKLSEKPLKYRLYSRVFQYSLEETIALFDSFPNDTTTYIEVGNFYDLIPGDRFYKYFESELVNRPNIRWLVPAKKYDWLIALGLPKECVEKDD